MLENRQIILEKSCKGFMHQKLPFDNSELIFDNLLSCPNNFYLIAIR